VFLAIPKNVANLINVVAERYGYYFATRKIQSELFRETKEERKKVQNLRKTIQNLVNEMVYDGKDHRKTIKELQKQLFEAKKQLKSKSAPFYEKKRPLIKAISLLDKEIIPQKLQEVGKKIEPRYTLSDWIKKELVKRQKKENKKQ